MTQYNHAAAISMLRHMVEVAAGGEIILRDFSRPIRERNNGLTGPYYFRPGALITDAHTVPEGFSGYLSKDESAIDEGAHVRLRVVAAGNLVNLKHDGWYTDDDCSETMYGVVARLPRSRGFLAGWTMGAQMATSFTRTIYQSEKEAARAADREAEYAAQRARDEAAKERAEDEAEQRQAEAHAAHYERIAGGPTSADEWEPYP